MVILDTSCSGFIDKDTADYSAKKKTPTGSVFLCKTLPGRTFCFLSNSLRCPTSVSFTGKATRKEHGYLNRVLLALFSGPLIHFKGCFHVQICFLFLLMFFKHHMQGGKSLYTEYQITGFNFPE